VRFIVPFPPGGSTDPAARFIAETSGEGTEYQSRIICAASTFLEGIMKTSLRPAATPSPQRLSRPRVNGRPYSKTRPSDQHPRRQFLRLAVGAVALPTVSCDPGTQSYPSRPITVIVPYAAGGTTDVIARNLAEQMKASLGHPSSSRM
jgi:hypothetical protein